MKNPVRYITQTGASSTKYINVFELINCEYVLTKYYVIGTKIWYSIWPESCISLDEFNFTTPTKEISEEDAFLEFL